MPDPTVTNIQAQQQQSQVQQRPQQQPQQSQQSQQQPQMQMPIQGAGFNPMQILGGLNLGNLMGSL